MSTALAAVDYKAETSRLARLYEEERILREMWEGRYRTLAKDLHDAERDIQRFDFDDYAAPGKALSMVRKAQQVIRAFAKEANQQRNAFTEIRATLSRRTAEYRQALEDLQAAKDEGVLQEMKATIANQKSEIKQLLSQIEDLKASRAELRKLNGELKHALHQQKANVVITSPLAPSPQQQEKSERHDVAWFKRKLEPVTSMLVEGRIEEVYQLVDAVRSLPKHLKPGQDPEGAERLIQERIEQIRKEDSFNIKLRFREEGKVS